jgi:hypothetical protein
MMSGNDSPLARTDDQHAPRHASFPRVNVNQER